MLACVQQRERSACSAGTSDHSDKQTGQMEESVEQYGLDDGGGAATAVALLDAPGECLQADLLSCVWPLLPLRPFQPYQQLVLPKLCILSCGITYAASLQYSCLPCLPSLLLLS